MKITSITNSSKFTTFSSKKPGHITKNFIYTNAKKELRDTGINNDLKVKSSNAVNIIDLDKKLKALGITYINYRDNVINLASEYNQGFYTIRTKVLNMTLQQVKEWMLSSLNMNNNLNGGLKNYMELVKDLKRQDIIQKGLKIHTYEMNNFIERYCGEKFAAVIGKLLKKNIKYKDLFFIENDAIYYNKLSKTAYAVDMSIKAPGKENIRICNFITNDKNNVIGYTSEQWDAYRMEYICNHYKEQQEPSVKLKSIAERDNTKNFTEAFRFGNNDITMANQGGVEKIVDKLQRKLKQDGLTKEQLQFVKFYDERGKIQSRICYYDSTIGKSFVFNDNGDYLYQLEYIKDYNGEIVSSNRF